MDKPNHYYDLDSFISSFANVNADNNVINLSPLISNVFVFNKREKDIEKFFYFF